MRPIGRVGAFVIGDPRSGDAAHVRDLGGSQRHVFQRLGQPFADRVHHGRMERMRGAQPGAGDISRLQTLFQPVDSGSFTRHHVQPWGVVRGDIKTGFEVACQFVQRGTHRQHRAAGLVLHELPALADDVQPGFKAEHAREGRGGELAHRMADHRHRLDATRHPQTRTGVLRQIKGGLRQPRFAQGGGKVLVRRVTETQHRFDVETEDRLQYL